jgi:hypothetical protein
VTSTLRFPGPGCWKVKGQLGSLTLTFRVQIPN